MCYLLLSCFMRPEGPWQQLHCRGGSGIAYTYTRAPSQTGIAGHFRAPPRMRCDVANSELTFCCRLSDRQKFPSNEQKPQSVAHVKPSQYERAGEYVRSSQLVDPTLFRSEYWKQFPTHISKNYEASIVFVEVRINFIMHAAHGHNSLIYLFDIKNFTLLDNGNNQRLDST